MKRTLTWIIANSLFALILVLASCQATPAQTGQGQTVTGKVEGQQPATTTGTTTPTTVTTAPKGVEMVTDPGTGKTVEKPRYGGTITTIRASEPPYLDPWNGSMATAIVGAYLEKLALTNWAIDRNKFDFVFFPTINEYRGNIAESWEEPNPTTFIIKIRKGVKWQNLPPMNGRELNAIDVEWSWHRSLGLGSGFTKPTPNAAHATTIPWKSVKAIDKYTLEIQLSKPSLIAMPVVLLEGYEMSWIFPREVIEKYGDLNNWRNIVGSGPWMIFDHVSDSSWTFKKNPDYWGFDEKFPGSRLPYADELKSLVIPDQATRLAALRSGKIDLLSVSFEEASALRKSNPELVQVLTWAGSTNSISMRADTKPFDDVRVRKAMQMAVNMEEIAKTYYGGFADPTPLPHIRTPGFFTQYKDWPQAVKDGYKYDLEGAKKLLAEAGYPAGFKTTLDIAVGGLGTPVDLAEIFKGYLAKIGVDLQINLIQSSAYYGRIQSSTHSPMITWYTGSTYTPILWLKVQFYSKNFWNTHMNKDAAFDAMADKADSAATREEQQKLIKEAVDYATDKFWLVEFPLYNVFRFTQPWYKGWNGESHLGGGTTFGVIEARTWVDTDLKKKLSGK
jgi:peptide/nickel transport system substrate-binding protein